MTTPNLALPHIAAAQAQKHVTHNQSLDLLDGLVQLSVKDRDLSAPPASPAEGDRYIVAAGASGAWAGWDGDVAMFSGGAWLRLHAREGWRVWVEDEAALIVRSGGAWITLEAALGLVTRSTDVTLALSPNGAATRLTVAEETLTNLAGPTVTSSIVIPARAIALCVSTRTTSAITGATSYDCGIIGSPAKFGGSLSTATGASNLGIIWPEAFWVDTPIVLTANGGDFTDGAVRIAIHAFAFTPPD
ncbi:Protein of unknown function [Meinhardsimonia xiamenensis]|jgi:hypothetical protein|uniref:Uncharacterized protein n=1 Tax=Meinhardsimonia xiamenensis TaxID=990712 RepID=A0A1G9HC63_9RHOB|nr:DUF2793 domain-containing protein [Meinhardsimonia xiamenensis]PRX28668.1 uncharacterized protein DUF2793 [Meinhardsimonia xiamenensis]SDL10426.1 Protein of unknown function [Meinhardsimonia xiamenensis]